MPGVGVRERGDQFRRLARSAVHDLFDQRRPFGRLALTHVLMTAGDTMFAVSLAGSLFFSISPKAAQDKVLLYLVLTMAPFAVVAPLLGPVIDRSRGARRAMVVISALGRCALCPFLAHDIHSLLLFPEAFTMLVLSKVYLVTKGALVPEMASLGMLDPSGATSGAPSAGAGAPPGDPPDLAGLNARLGLLASLAGFVFALPAIGALKLGGPALVLWLALGVFAAAAVAGMRLPVRGRELRRIPPVLPVPPVRPAPAPTGDPAPGRFRPTGTPDVAPPAPPPVPATAPAPTGGVTFGRAAAVARGLSADLAEDEWVQDGADLEVYRPIAHGEVLSPSWPCRCSRRCGISDLSLGLRPAPPDAPTWWFGLLLGGDRPAPSSGCCWSPGSAGSSPSSRSWSVALWLVAAAAALGALVGSKEIQVVLAFAIGVAGAVAKPSFDALVQRYVRRVQPGPGVRPLRDPVPAGLGARRPSPGGADPADPRRRRGHGGDGGRRGRLLHDRAAGPAATTHRPRPTPARRTGPAGVTERARRNRLAQTLLEPVDLGGQLGGQFVAEGGEVLPDEGNLGPPLVRVHRQQLGHVLVGHGQPVGVDGPGGGDVADGRVHGVAPAAHPLEDPLEHTGVLAVPGPQPAAVGRPCGTS